VFDTQEAVEHRLDLGLVGDLDEERGAELAGTRQEGVVNVELVTNLGIIRDPLDAAHFLDLEEHGVHMPAFGLSRATGCRALAHSGRLSISGGPFGWRSPSGSGSREPGRTT